MKRLLPFLAAGLAGGAIAGGTVAVVDGGNGSTVYEQAPLAASSDISARGGLTAADIYRRYSDGVAYVEAEVRSQGSSPFNPFGAPQQGTATGTGFVVDRDGDILTNAHVVEGATSITVRLGNNRRLSARLVGTDRSTDLALLKVDPDGQDLTVLPLGSSTNLTVGDPTVAIGNPFGLERTLTTGVISATQRRIEAPDGLTINNVIQTDAAINPGNSGGPLIDASGRVIGINSQIATGQGPSSSGGNVGIGFAVPINTAKEVIPQLKESGSISRGYLGVTTATIDDDLSSLDLPVDYGALVQSVEPGSPAARAGIRAGRTSAEVDGQQVRLGGDIILAVNGTRVTEERDLQELIASREANETVRLLVRSAENGGSQRTVSVRLARRSSNVQ